MIRLVPQAVAIFLGFGNERCYIYVPEGGDILIDCNQCSDGAGLLWRDWFVFFVGLAAISLGIYGGTAQMNLHCVL